MRLSFIFGCLMLSYLILLDFGSFGEGRTEAPFGVSLAAIDPFGLRFIR